MVKYFKRRCVTLLRTEGQSGGPGRGVGDLTGEYCTEQFIPVCTHVRTSREGASGRGVGDLADEAAAGAHLGRLPGGPVQPVARRHKHQDAALVEGSAGSGTHGLKRKASIEGRP